MSVTYLHLPPGEEPPAIDALRPFKAVLVLDQAVSEEWQGRVSDWLVKSGCLYMMAWGTGCSSWDDSVDYANLSATDFGDMSDDQFVLTTWHDDEPLAATFWFAGHAAVHPTVPLSNVVIIDVGVRDRETRMREAYALAQTETV
ncbi:MAG: hypothetical protein ACK4JY_11300 [Brevundimonas sp.]|uniref:DUF7684 family protein n=1 Tax=Brevundimonas sp. TaxID=1871086 RepID=UPI00391C6AAD